MCQFNQPLLSPGGGVRERQNGGNMETVRAWWGGERRWWWRIDLSISLSISPFPALSLSPLSLAPSIFLLPLALSPLSRSLHLRPPSLSPSMVRAEGECCGRRHPLPLVFTTRRCPPTYLPTPPRAVQVPWGPRISTERPRQSLPPSHPRTMS